MRPRVTKAFGEAIEQLERELRAAGYTHVEQMHALALAAKELVFKAQDAASCAVYNDDRVPAKVHRAIKRLGRVRSELEQADNNISDSYSSRASAKGATNGD